MTHPTFETFADVVRHRAQAQGDQLAFQFLVEGEVDGAVETLGFRALLEDAERIAARLERARTKRALLLYPPGLDFIRAFVGCLLAGVVAVPAYPPDPTRLDRTLPRLRAIAADAGAELVLSTARVTALSESGFADAPELRSCEWIATDALAREPHGYRAPPVGSDEVAFLHYTSGSTGSPKGVMVTHRNLLASSAEVHRLAGRSPESVVVSWLPPYHDLGLIGGILQPLYGGFSAFLMSPVHFLERPLRWLRAISRHRATSSAFPSFALDLCAHAVTPEELAALDLSSWKFACHGAEPIRWESLVRFSEVFGPAGFSARAHSPAYGLAEATLVATGTESDEPMRSLTVDPAALRHDRVEVRAAGRTLVGCGRAIAGHEIAVVDPSSGLRLRDRRVGEILVRGPCVAAGYWGRPHETHAAFGARIGDEGPFLRTGDLGFLDDGELYVTGRAKDLLILRGENHYPQDIELTAERAHVAVRTGCVIAFSIDVRGEERLAVAAEIGNEANVDEVLGALRDAVWQEHELSIETLWLLSPSTIPKTSSGKLQRWACRYALLGGSLAPRHRWQREERESDDATLDEREEHALDPTVSKLLVFLQGWLAESLGVSPSQIAVDCPLTELGLDSVVAIQVAHALEAKLQRPVDASLAFKHPTLLALARHLSTAASKDAPPARLIVERVAPREHYPLSFMERQLFELLQRGGQTAYNLFVPVRLRVVEPAALNRAFCTLLDRHENLRTSFVLSDGEPVRRIESAAEVARRWSLRVEDLRAMPREASADAIARASDEVRHHEHDLARPPLLEARLLLLGDEGAVLLTSVNHLAVDAWSLGVFFDELGFLHEAYRRGDEPRLAPLPLRAVDYAVAASGALADVRARGRDVFPPYPADGYRLPLDRPRPATPSQRGARYAFVLDPSLRDELVALCKVRGWTPAMAILVAYQIALHRHARREDVAFTLVQGNRRIVGLRGAVGLFVYGETFHGELRGRPTYAELLARARSFVQDERPFALQIYNFIVQPPSIRVSLNVHNFHAAASSGPPVMVPAPDLNPYAYLWDTHDLMLNVIPTPVSFVCDLLYRSEVLDLESVQAIADGMPRALRELIATPDDPATL